MQSKTRASNVSSDCFSEPKPNDNSLNVTVRVNKFGLWATGSTRPEKTILLNDGVAKNEATFTLVLREGEELKGMRHHPGDSSIITSYEEARDLHATNPISYNITITHHFSGTVGITQYELTILTTKGASLRVIGTYYVAGIVLYASTDSKPPRIVSGLTSPPLTVNTISSFSSLTGLSTHHRVTFPFKFQNVGPDINPNPPSILNQLSKAVVSVDSTNAGGHPILSNRSACRVMRKEFYATQSNSSHEDNCDAGLDLDSMSLELNLHPEGYGMAVIDISFPETSTKSGRMKTQLRLNVLKPAIIRPELDLKRSLRLRLDHFGTESFSLPIKNKNADGEERKVLSYVVDLPGNRYAISDFNASSLGGMTQMISFSVIPQELENNKLQEAIKHALKLANARRRKALEELSYVDVRQLKRSLNRSSPFLNNFLAHIVPLVKEQNSSDLGVTSADLVPEMNYSYESHVLALFPRTNTLVTALNPSGFYIWTSISSDKLARVEKLRVLRGNLNMLFKVTLLRYTSSTFSQHKSMQISRSLSKQVSLISRTGVERSKLVKIVDKGISLEVIYHLVTPMKFTDNDIKLNKYKQNISRSVSSDVLLKKGELEVKEIVRLVRMWRPSGEGSKTVEEANRLKGIKGVLVAIFVGISAVILIPVLIFCVPSLGSSRSRANDSSSHDNGQEIEEPKNDEDDRKSSELHQTASDVLKDNYGRADGSSYRSFKVASDMARQGYYGNEASSAARKTITFADT